MAKTKGTNRLAHALGRAYTRKWSFLAAFAFVFFISLSFLSTVGFVPEEKDEVAAEAVPVVLPVGERLPVEAPLRIEIPEIGMNVTIKNPSTTDVATLDAALLSGAVRYPTSAKPGEAGNTILFGHSSYLPVVNNKAYKAFNAIQDLEKGDRITVSGNGTAYVYEVEKVYQADAEAAAIPLSTTGHTLTLVTCDSFATKSDRFVVTATLVGTHAL